MAYTTSISKKTVFGDMRVQMYDITADAATAAIDTGLESVIHLDWAPNSCSTAAVKFDKNVLAAGTIAAGYIAITGAASGDEFFVTVYGV